MTRDLSDYVDVTERIRLFKAAYPDGSLQSWHEPFTEEVGDKTYIVYSAAAYRTPDDERPGIGWAWEPVPGPTPFTRDSELMNAETSAWGRAIVALGFETKKIASRNEVRNRQSSEREHISEQGAPPDAEPSRSEGFQAPKPATEKPIDKGVLDEIGSELLRLNEAFPEHPGQGRTWADVAREHSRDRFQKSDSKKLTLAEGHELRAWLEDEFQQAAREAQIPFEAPA